LAIYLWAFMLVVSLVMMTIYPILIAPLFNKFTPVSAQDFFTNRNRSIHPVIMFGLVVLVSLLIMTIASRGSAKAEN
jgi:hypothetical protein